MDSVVVTGTTAPTSYSVTLLWPYGVTSPSDTETIDINNAKFSFITGRNNFYNANRALATYLSGRSEGNPEAEWAIIGLAHAGMEPEPLWQEIRAVWEVDRSKGSYKTPWGNREGALRAWEWMSENKIMRFNWL
jgi:hypothetical protein